MATTKIPSPTATAIVAPPSSLTHQSLYLFSKLPFPTLPISRHRNRPITKLHVSSPPNKTPATAATAAPTKKPKEETVFFDGGAHYGDLLANLLLGFTLFWLPLTLAAVSRAFNLRYRFTNLRVTVISGLTGEDRSDFSYKVIKDVQVVPRFIEHCILALEGKTEHAVKIPLHADYSRKVIVADDKDSKFWDKDNYIIDSLYEKESKIRNILHHLLHCYLHLHQLKDLSRE